MISTSSRSLRSRCLQNICRELSRRLRVTNQRLQAVASEHDDDEHTLLRPAIKRR